MKLFGVALLVLLSGLSAFSQEKVEKSDKTEQNIRPLKITYRPKPAYADQSKGSVCVTGAVRLRIQFLASGKIGAIKAVTTLPYGLTENSIEAAKKIKFEPQLVDDKPVTVTKVIEYIF